MAFTPISNTVPQYEENGIAASGFYIKFYEAGTTTPTAMATDSTGSTLLDKCELNTEGYPKNGSNAVFIPHIDRRYKIALFRNATDADNNNLNNAVWPVDNLEPVLTEGAGEVATIADLRGIEPAQDGQQISLLGHTLAGIGAGEFYYDASDTTSADNNGTIVVTAGLKRWKRILEQPYVTPEMFGAISGLDSFRPFQDAIDFCDSIKATISLSGITYLISETLKMPRRISIIGVSRDLTIIRPTAAIRMMEWFGGSGFSGSIVDVKFEGNNLATEGVLIGAGADYTMRRCHIVNVAGVGLVQHTTQNSRFDQLQLESCETNLLWTNGAWNNYYSRCEFATATNYHLHSKNDAAYVAITGEPATSAQSARHNTVIASIMEQGGPINLIRLEDNSSENSFLALEMQSGSTGNPQVLILSGGNNYFGQNTNFQKGAPAASFAIENEGFGTTLDGCTTTGWAGVTWAKSTEYMLVENLAGDATPGNIDSGILKAAVENYTQTIGGGRYWVINGSLKSTQFGSNARSGVLIDGDLSPETPLNKDLGLLNAWRTAYVQDVRVGGTLADPLLLSGVGSPEGVKSAPVGSIFMRSDGGAGTSMYVKESGAGNTGWVAK